MSSFSGVLGRRAQISRKGHILCLLSSRGTVLRPVLFQIRIAGGSTSLSTVQNGMDWKRIVRCMYRLPGSFLLFQLSVRGKVPSFRFMVARSDFAISAATQFLRVATDEIYASFDIDDRVRPRKSHLVALRPSVISLIDFMGTRKMV